MSEALQLPRTVHLGDGTDITIRLLQRADRDALLAFTRGLPEHDLLFLRMDITNPDVVDGWLDNVEHQRVISIIAEREGRIFGYASLHLGTVEWSRHVGEIRVLVGEEMRGKRLGRTLTEAIFARALDNGVEKMVAQMTLDQKGAIATFEELGFRPEALLRDHVVDRAGLKHDLLMYSHDVRAFESQMDAYGVTEAAGGN